MNTGKYYQRQRRRELKRREYGRCVMETLDAMSMELCKEWVEREIRDTMCVMYRFTGEDKNNNYKTYYVATPKVEENPLIYAREYCDSYHGAASDLSHLLK